MTTSPNPTEAEKVVAEWRAAMEGVTPGPWRPSRFGFQVVSDYPEPAWQSVVELTTVARSEPNVEREMLTQKAIANWLARCSPSGISDLLAHIESQRATIERVERERDSMRLAILGGEDMPGVAATVTISDCLTFLRNERSEQRERAEAAEARVTALEAEKAGLVALLEEARPHVAKIAGCIRINDEMGRVVTGQTEAAAALRDIFGRTALQEKTDDL